MKKILFVINTMGRAGAEMALLELLRCLVKYDGLELSLFVLTGQGEMISQVPEEVKLLNKNFDECSVLPRIRQLREYRFAARRQAAFDENLCEGAVQKRNGVPPVSISCKAVFGYGKM